MRRILTRVLETVVAALVTENMRRRYANEGRSAPEANVNN
jgi:hypothetical protein